MPIETRSLRALVVDDEKPGRERIIRLLRSDPVIGHIEEAQDGPQCVALLESQRYDLLFLDVQMPEMTGIEVAQQLDDPHSPVIVFITAFDQYAVAAFETEAADYLLKPFSDARFESTLDRAKRRIEERRLRLTASNESPSKTTPPPPLQRLVFKDTRGIEVVDVNEIRWIEAAGVYVTLHRAEKSSLLRSSLTSLTARLDSSKFVRIHRSAAINLQHLLRLVPLSHGEFDAILSNGAAVRVSRSYCADLKALLKQ